jgi:hypothetical protein
LVETRVTSRVLNSDINIIGSTSSYSLCSVE